MPRHITTTSDGTLVCIAYQYKEDGVTIMDEECNKVRDIPLKYCTRSVAAAGDKSGECQLGPVHLTDTHLYMAEKGMVYKIDFNGELTCRFGTLDSTISCITIGQDGLIYIGNLNRLANFQGVLVYKCNGNFSHVLCQHIHPIDMAFDRHANIHICDNRTNTIKVFDKDGHMVMAYGNGHLQNPLRIAIHPNDFIIVLESVSLLVFNEHGSYLYEIDLDQNGVQDFTVTSNGTLWLSDNYFNLITQHSNAFYHPPPSLKMLCQSKILLNIAELPVNLLPGKYLSMCKDWSKTVEYKLVDSRKTGVNTTTGMLSIPAESKGQTVAMILEDKTGISYSILSQHMKYNERLGKVMIDIGGIQN